MSRFLLVVSPQHGYLYPMLAIGQQLAFKGHEAIWCGPENVLRPLVGPDAIVHSTGPCAYRRGDDTGMAGLRALWDEYLVPFTRAILDPVDVAVTEYRPDVVVVEQYALAGALVAHRRGVPWATVATGALELTPPADLTGLAGFVADRVAQVVALAGLPAGEPIDPRFSPHLVIALTTRGLAGAAELPDRCVLTGAALGTRPDAPDFPWRAWDPAARHVLVTAGDLDGHTTEHFQRRMAAALVPMVPGVQAVFVASGVAADPFPANAITAERVPVLDVMPRLDAVVCHGGGVVNEALASGVPLVVAPVRPEQVALARQVTASGAGLGISMSDAATADLAAAVRAVLDEPGYRERAGLIAAEFASAGGAAAAAAHLAALAAHARLRSAQQAPRNPIETAMVRIWADLLDTTEPPGVHDNLFGLGAGSLAAVRFAAWTSDTYGVHLAIHHIVATPTIAALAEIVSADLNSADVAETAGEAELAALPDEELDDLVRALFAARDRRRAAREDGSKPTRNS